jgi:hypothetical protein
MAPINDTILIQTLIDSYRGQLERYRSLDDIVRQLISRLILSRGDMSQVSAGFREKQALIDAIETERVRVADLVARWELRKTAIGHSDSTDAFDVLLQQVADTIRRFLEDETQLQQYLEGIIARTKMPGFSL